MFTEVFDVPANVTESLMLVLLWLRLFSCFLSLDSSSDTGSESDGVLDIDIVTSMFHVGCPCPGTFIK